MTATEIFLVWALVSVIAATAIMRSYRQMNPKRSRQATQNAMMDTNTTDKWGWIGWFLLGALAALSLLIILFGGWVVVK